MIFLWVALYGLAYAFSEKVCLLFDCGRWPLFVGMTLYVCALIAWTVRSGHLRILGLKPNVRVLRSRWPTFLIVLLLPAVNLAIGPSLQSTPDWASVLLMLPVAIAEEIFFRGFMFRYFQRRNTLLAELMTSVVFAGMHCVNLFIGAAPAYVAVQMLCALAAGLLYAGIAADTGSLLPSIIAHFLTNAAGYGRSPDTGPWWALLLLALCALIYAVHGIRLCRNIHNKSGRIHHDTVH